MPVAQCLGVLCLALVPLAALLFTLYVTFIHSYNSSSANKSGSETGILFFGIRNLYTQFNGSEDNRRMGMAEALNRAVGNANVDDRFDPAWYSCRCCHGNPIISGIFALVIGLILMPIAFVAITLISLIAVFVGMIITLL